VRITIWPHGHQLSYAFSGLYEKALTDTAVGGAIGSGYLFPTTFNRRFTVTTGRRLMGCLPDPECQYKNWQTRHSPAKSL